MSQERTKACSRDYEKAATAKIIFSTFQTFSFLAYDLPKNIWNSHNVSTNTKRPGLGLGVCIGYRQSQSLIWELARVS